MNEQRQVEELAKIEGRYDCRWTPNYLNSHDSIQRVYKTLTKRQKRAVVLHLRMIDADYDLSPDEVGFILGSTASAIAEAVLKAYGKWEESSEAGS